MEANDNHGIISYQVDETSDLSINISDVIAVIEREDPSVSQAMFHDSNLNAMVNAGQQISQINGVQGLHQEAPKPYVEILEHPAPKALRFRYECEGRSAGSIPGANSTADNKTYPTIKVMNYVGRAVVVVSCVTKDSPHKPHPHNLVGREGCKKGVCTLEINSDDMKMVFSNLGIQCVKKRDIEEALRVREEIRVDPFRTGYSHRSQPSSIDLNAVRLCFQVFLEGPVKGKFTMPCNPVVSDTIFDKKSMSDLVISKLSHCNAPCTGSQEMILLCEKVAKEDIQIRFYDDSWEAFGEFQQSQVHKQVAISFRTPKYKSIDLSSSVMVKVELRRPSDGATSEALDFEILPLNEEPIRKRQKSSDDNPFKKSPAHDGQFPRTFKAIDQPVKLEPREHSPYTFYPGTYRETSQATPSPQPLSPPMFVPDNHSPLPGNFLQASNMMPSNFPHQPQYNQSYTPNIQVTTTQYSNNGNIVWANNMNGNDPTTSRAFTNNTTGQPSTIFNEQLAPQQNINPIFSASNEPRLNSSFFMDLDSNLDRLSGDLSSLLNLEDGASFTRMDETLTNRQTTNQ